MLWKLKNHFKVGKHILAYKGLLCVIYWMCYPRNMRRRKKFSTLLFLTILFWALLGFFTFKFSPEENMMGLVFPLVFLATFSLLAFLLNNLRWGLLGGMGITVFLILRFLKLTSPFYLLILLLTLIALEVAFRKS